MDKISSQHFSIMEEGKEHRNKTERQESLLLSSSSTHSGGAAIGREYISGEEGETTRLHSSSAGRYVPSKGEFFEKRETRVDNERKRVTYILQTSGSHGRSIEERQSNDETASTDSHCHSQIPKTQPDKTARRKLILASILCLLFMIGETVGGIIAGSLAIISDAAHLLTDFASFMISLMALYLARKPATKKLSFGWYRIEILGALMSILMLWVLTGILVYSAVERITSGDYEIDATIMLITAGTGVAFNIVLGTTLHQHAHSHGGGHGHSHGGHGHSHGGHDHHGHGRSPTGHFSEYEVRDRQHSQSLVPSSPPDVTPSHNHIGNSSNNIANIGGGGGGSSSGRGSLSAEDGRVFVITPNRRAAAPGRGYGAIPSDNRLAHSDQNLTNRVDESAALLSHSVSTTASDHHHHDHHHHHHKESNINVKAAFIHVIGDLFQSVGVLVAAFIIYYKPEWKIADPICTFLFSLFVLITTITILRDILVVLMEGTPRGINFAEVREAFFQVNGVLDIHNLRVWSLTMDKIALSVHIAVDKDSDPHDVLRRASSRIQRQFAISETTMQIEEYVTEMQDCEDCQGPKL